MNDHATPEEEDLPDAAPAEDSASGIDIAQVKRVLEAALLSTPEPLTVQQLKRLFAGEVAADNIRKVLDELKAEWADRTVELTSVATGWRFRVKPDYQPFLDRITNEKPPRYSRAVLETLAIVAYRQPVTRGDIEDIRGVAVGTPIVKQLEDRGWIEAIGHREAPGRPALYATTRQFLDDLGLASLDQLPALDGTGGGEDRLAQALADQPGLIDAEVAADGQASLALDPPDTEHLGDQFAPAP
jgi:segregation and condensation protein B